MKCPNCGKDIDESIFSTDLTFCPYCGEKLEVTRLQFCPYCGQKLTTQSSFCPHCGKKLAFAEGKADGEQLVKDFIGEKAKTVEEKAKTVAKAIRNTFGRERKIKKLYNQWAEFSNLPPEEVPTIEELKKMSAEEKAGEDSKSDDDED
ncbi:MAG: zinc ribbon domain-containing protein [Dehalococcoidales bacterium]|nr:zinc ribbon domain-containing protein [Dehalococcoidales bacterium]